MTFDMRMREVRERQYRDKLESGERANKKRLKVGLRKKRKASEKAMNT